MDSELWEVVEAQQPIVATAIHNGHALRDEVRELVKLSDEERLREEDPYTDIFATAAGTRIIPARSRFEVDLNRPRESAVYVTPEDAWGLGVWLTPPPQDLIDRSLAEYDAFYAKAHEIFTEMEERYGHFVVLDVHSYNHRRGGAEASPADPKANPEINVGTGSLDRERWGTLVDRFMGDMAAFDYMGRHLDVRENVKFRGGHFSTWIHENFPESGCCLAIEFKKFWMDEWTGKFNPEEYEASAQALAATIPGLLESLAAMEIE